MTTQDEIEQERAYRQYTDQVNTFRTLLNAGNRLGAYQHARACDWPTDMITDEVMDWLCAEPKGQR